jgi:hypothetical protein
MKKKFIGLLVTTYNTENAVSPKLNHPRKFFFYVHLKIKPNVQKCVEFQALSLCRIQKQI